MYKLSIDLDRKLEIMSKHSLTGEEWLFIELLFTAIDGLPQYLVKYFNECKKATIPRDTIQALKDKKVFAASYSVPNEGEDFDVEEVEFGKTFINNYFKGSFEAGRELWNDLFLKYNKNIQYKVENHEKVMEMLQWAKDNKLLQYSIVEYIVSRKWEAHKEMKDSGEIGKIAFTVETMDDV